MSVAARAAGWAQRLRNTPGPLQGASLAGTPFLTDIFGPNARILVEMAFGADLAASPDTWSWTDITAYVRQADGQRISITPMGRGDETSKSQPAGCSFEVDNTTSDFSKGPGSKWYPYIRRNTPVRVRLTIDGSSWFIRFQGQANGFTPSWDTSANLAVVTVSASGKLRQLQQGKTPLRSPLYRAIAALSPVAHWPFEDGTDAKQAASAVTGVNALTVGSGTVAFGDTTVKPAGAAASANIVGGHLLGSIPPRSDPNGWAVICAFRATRPAGTAAFLEPLVEWTTVDGNKWEIQPENTFDVDASPPHLRALCWTSGILGKNLTGIDPYDGNWHMVAVVVTKVTSTTSKFELFVDGLYGTVTDVQTFSPLGGPLSFPGQYLFSNNSSIFISNLAFVETTSITIANLNSALAAWTGESATGRMSRICAEEGVPLTVTGISDTAMGAQGIDTFVNLLREAESTDDGVLYDGRGPGLAYVARSVRYNAATALTADMAADPPQVALPFAPVDDDQRNRNLMKVDRKNGSSATYEDNFSPLGTRAIGTYDSSLTVNTQTDDGLGFRAAHEVHKGTIDGLRYPALNLDLAAVLALAPAWLLADVSSRLAIANVTSRATQHPPGNIDLVLEGWAETLGPFDWTAAGNCSPFVPWRVGVIEGAGDTAWRIDSGSSALAADAAVGATSLSVASTDPAELWSISGGDYPRDIDVGGVQVTVTAVSGASSPQTFTVNPLPYRLTAGWTVKLWRPPTIAL